MVVFFRERSIISFVFLVALCLLVHFHFFMMPAQIAVSENDGILSMLLTKYGKPLPAAIIFVLYIGLVLVQAIRLDFVLNEMKMFHHAGFTTAMSYVLLSAFMPQWSTLTPALIANLLVIWIFLKLSRLYNNASPKKLLFNTGLIVGLTVLCYHPTAILIPVVFFALAVVRPFRWAEWFVLLAGIITPFYFLIAILYLIGKMSVLTSHLPELAFNLPLKNAFSWLWLNLAAMALLVVAGLYYWVPANNRMVIQLRKNWGILLVMFIILLPVSFIFKTAGVESAILIIVPLAAIISNLYLNPKRLLIPNLLFWLSIVIIIHNNIQLAKF